MLIEVWDGQNLANFILMFTAFLQIPSPDYMIHKHGECTGNQFGSLYYDHFYQENHVVAQWVSVTTSRLMVRLLKMSIYEFVMTTWRIIPGLVSVVRVTTPSFTSHGVLPFGRGKPVNRNPILTRGQKLTMGQLTAY